MTLHIVLKVYWLHLSYTRLSIVCILVSANILMLKPCMLLWLRQIIETYEYSGLLIDNI